MKPLPELPNDCIEYIFSKTTICTKAICSITNKYYRLLIGDIRPIRVIHQMYFLDLLTILCSCSKYSFFNLRINSSDYHIIISDENNYSLLFQVIKKGYYQKILTRYYQKIHIVKNLQNLFNRDTVLKGSDSKSKYLFENIFENIYGICLSSGKKTPQIFFEWKHYIKNNRILKANSI
jgi:hypothetical protein